ncbi:hypothetical protein V1264_016555 [Littorina saxatilis]|uniref:Poly [ADP-ribose] polymerase n=2 Tax=Littorina saxatilis TaxID=31220 RepID=A0AAN9BPB1_9CAEN
MCQELDLDGNTVRVSKVPMSSCLVVTNVDPVIKEHLIKLYFESTDSLGGPVMSVERKGRKGKWFVLFKDYKVADRVLQQTHCLAGKKLKVKRHLPCLGEDGGSHEPNTFAMPQDLVLSGVEKHKLTFIRQARSTWDELCGHLARVHAMPTVESDVLIVTCSLTVEVPKARVLAKTWQHDARAAAERYLGLLEVHKRNVIGEMWKEAGVAVEKANIASTQDAMVLKDPQDTAYIVVGIKTAVDALLQEVDCTIKELEDEVERKKQEITDRKKLKPGQAQLLSAIGFPSQAQEMSKNLQVEISPTEILFHGNLPDVQKAMLQMFERLAMFTTKTTAIGSKQKLDYLRHRQVEQYVSEKLRAQSPTIVWEVTDETGVKVRGLEGDDLANALTLIDSAVCECEIQLPPESSDLPKSKEWKKMVHELAEENPGCLSVCSPKEDKVFIIGTDNVFKKARDEVNAYLSLNTIYTEVVFFSPSRQKFITTFMMHRLQEIERTFWTHKVQIKPIDSNEKIEVRGREKGVDQAKSKLQDVERDIVCHEESVTDSAKITFLESKSCLRDLGLVATEARCVFAFTQETSGMQVESPSDTTSEGFRVKQTRRGVQTTLTLLYQGATLSTVEGDITQMKVDAIVNAANDRMDHNGGLAKDVITKGGQEIQLECRRLLTKRGNMSDGDVLISGPGRLPCKAIFHAVGPSYKDGTRGERDSLQLTVTNCLDLAVAKGYDSVAFPAISSGIFRYPPAQSTCVIVGAVKAFLEKTSGIKEVFFCAFDQTMRLHFEAAFGTCFPQLAKNTAPPTKVFSSTVGRLVSKTVPRAGALFQEKTAKPGVVRIVEGQIAQQTADVIVNSTSVDLKLKNGAVSKSLLTAAGLQLQEECKAKYPTNLLTGQIAVTSGYGLACKEVYHIALPRWDGPVSKSILHGYVMDCLDLASVQGYTSVAFPVLGTGNCSFPHDVVAQTMLRAMEEFQDTRPLSPLREITVVVYHTDTQILQAFREEQGRGTGLSQSSRASVPAKAGIGFPSLINFASSDSEGAKASPLAKLKSAAKGKLAVVTTGLLAEQQVDAVVNSASHELDLTKGAVAASILEGAGQEIEDECKTKRPDGIETGEIVLTKGYQLPCKEVLHTALDPWQGPADEQILHKTVLDCLDVASQRGHTTIALPAMGTGNLNYPHDVVARTMLDAVDHFQRTRPDTTLREVRIVLYHLDIKSVQAFEAAAAQPRLTHNASLRSVPATAQPSLTHNASLRSAPTTAQSSLTHNTSLRSAPTTAQSSLTHNTSPRSAPTTVQPPLTHNTSLRSAPTTAQPPLTHNASLRFAPTTAQPPLTHNASLRSAPTTAQPPLTHNASLRSVPAGQSSVVANRKRSGGFLSWFGKSRSSRKIQAIEQGGAVAASSFLAPKEPKVLIIYAENQWHIDDFKEQFNQLVDGKFTRTEIKFETHSENYSAQIAAIERIGLQHNVQTDVQSSKERIVLHGFNNDVLDAYAAISDFLKDNLVASMVQWCFIEVQTLGTERVGYHSSVNAIIEAAYKKQEKTVEIKDADGDVYVIDFQEMVEYRQSDPQSRLDVNRRIIIQESGTEPPPHWASQKDDLNMVQLKPTATEYKEVEANFLSSAGNKKVVVTAIDRVQSRTLYSQYQTKKTQLEAQNPDIQNEKTLWHGTASDATDNINRYGFNRSYCGKNATKFGAGVYFAVDSEYSIRSTYSPPDGSGLCRVYQCKVLVGHSVVGNEKMRFLPQRRGSDRFYDSAVDSKIPGMYVIFNDTQAYPEYLVTFKYQ